MTRFYSDPSREHDKWALPDCEVFELTAPEVAEREEDLIHDYMKDPRFKLASMSSKAREQMFEEMIRDEQISGGWFYWFCFPGCIPESEPFGPYDTAEEAMAAARDMVSE